MPYGIVSLSQGPRSKQCRNWKTWLWITVVFSLNLAGSVQIHEEHDSNKCALDNFVMKDEKYLIYNRLPQCHAKMRVLWFAAPFDWYEMGKLIPVYTALQHRRRSPWESQKALRNVARCKMQSHTSQYKNYRCRSLNVSVMSWLTDYDEKTATVADLSSQATSTELPHNLTTHYGVGWYSPSTFAFRVLTT
jgi:hypothetical protein